MVATASLICTQRFERVPSVIPRRFPAPDKSWHGVPPAMMSTGSTADQSMRVMSPWFGTPGQCFASTFDGAASNSENHAVRAPKNASTAMSSPP
jgi:hypothetical protein